MPGGCSFQPKDTVGISMLIFKVQIGRANSNTKATTDHIYDQMILPDLCVDTKYRFNQRMKENNFLVLYMERKK